MDIDSGCILLVAGGVIDVDDLEDHKILDANLVIEQICICKSHRGWSHERFCFSNEGVFFLAPRDLLLEIESFLEDQKVFGANLVVVQVCRAHRC